MKDIKGALSHMVTAGMKADELQKAYVKVGLNDNIVFTIWSEVVSGIYDMVGENTPTFEESATATVMTAPYLTVERRTEMLYAEYCKNHPDQPKPQIIEPDAMRRMMERNGGYMTPEGDWP